MGADYAATAEQARVVRRARRAENTIEPCGITWALKDFLSAQAMPEVPAPVRESLHSWQGQVGGQPGTGVRPGS